MEEPAPTKWGASSAPVSPPTMANFVKWETQYCPLHHKPPVQFGPHPHVRWLLLHIGVWLLRPKPVFSQWLRPVMSTNTDSLGAVLESATRGKRCFSFTFYIQSKARTNQAENHPLGTSVRICQCCPFGVSCTAGIVQPSN